MRKNIKGFFHFIKDSFNFLIFLIRLLLQGAYKNKLENKFEGTVAVLANGPSLNEELSKLNTDEEFKNVDYIVLNFFAFEKTFFEIKPKHYCLADPMFFQDSHRKEDVEKLFKILDGRVDWDIYFYIPSRRYENFISFSKLENKHIIIIKINSFPYSGFDNLRHFFYKKNLSMPDIKTVANLAIFIGLNRGYSKINIYGVDHTFFNDLEIDDKNQLCSVENHFYKKGNSIMKPLKRNDNNEIWKISDFLVSTGGMFKSHDQLNEYAKYLKVMIINHTSCSMIDSYERYSNY